MLNLFIFLCSLVVIFSLTHIIAGMVRSSSFPRPIAHLKNYFRYGIIATGYILLLLLTCEYFHIDLTPLYVAFGGGSIVFAFAAKEILENLISGIILALQRPFTLGDKLTIGSFAGTVDSIHPRHTCLHDDSGQLLYIPNAMLIKSVLIVHPKPTATDSKPAKKRTVKKTAG